MSYVASVCPLNGIGSSYLANLHPTTFVAQTPFTGYSGYDYWYKKIVGRNGLLYGDYGSMTLKRFDSTNNTWTTVLGTGVIGICADDTVATSCAVNLQDVFVNSSGQVYFMDNGMLRTIDPSTNQVVTLMGQSNFYGHNVSPMVARFGNLLSFDVMSNGNIITNDSNTRIREVIPNSTIQTIAGNGTLNYQNVAVSALTQGFWGNSYLKVNPSTGDVFMGMSIASSGAALFKLTYSTKMWSRLAGGGATSYASADGTVGNQISFPKILTVVGFDGSNVLATVYNQNASQQVLDSYLKKYSITDGTQANIMGTSPINSSSTFCSPGSSPGVAPSACNIPRPTVRLSIMSLDTYSSPNRWIALASENPAVISIPTDGSNVTAITTLASTPVAMDYRHDASNHIIYYCSSVDGKLYKKDLNASTDTAFDWPIPGLACKGPSLVYRASTNRLIFSYTLNGLWGIAEYVAP
jgi:hypothetical protein